MTSRKDQKERLRQERIAREQAAAEAARRKRFVGLGVAGLLVVAAAVAIALTLIAGGDGDEPGADAVAGTGVSVSYSDDLPEIPDAREFDLRRAAAAADCELVDPPNEGSDHVEGSVQYRANPPTSGNHHPVPTEDGVFEQRPRVENAVHSLEHGRIHIQFSPDLPQQRIDQLRALYEEDPYHVLLYPNADMPFEVAVTAWDHALTCERMGEDVFDAIRAFKDAYRDKGPEFVP